MGENQEKAQIVMPLAMVLCESFSRDLVTQRLNLDGLLSGAIIVPEVPARIHFAVYATFSDIRQKATYKFELIDIDDNIIAQSSAVEMEKPSDPMVEAVVTAVFVNVEIPKFGQFFVRLLANDEYIIERRLLVIEPPSTE